MPAPNPEARELRQELKAWERAFADANGGRKPTREEIKRDKAIAAKYTEYYKIQPSSKAPKAKSRDPQARDPQKPKQTTPSAIPHDPTNPFAPSLPSSSAKSTATTIPSRPTTSTSASTSIFRTPSKPPHRLQDHYDSPLSSRGRRLFGNRPRDSVGPTPQKTGKVLGIFESFDAYGTDVESTPPHRRATPRKAAPAAAATAAFSTPRKRKAGELGAAATTTPRTPGTVRDVFSTPAFLRRSFVGSLEESPPVAAPRRRPLVKGLSTMVAELRKLEDEAHNEAFGDDEEAMREMEAGHDGPVAKKPKEVAEETIVPGNDPDTGLPPLPEGAWREEERVEEEESGDEKEDKTRRWKKKGLKRQHRRVIMRPVGKTTTATTAGSEAEPPPPPNPEEIELPGAGYSDEDLSDLDNLPDEPQRPAPAAAAAEKKSTRKVAEKAHVNYRRLNIRGSKGAKAANNRTGRFARRKR